MAPLPVATMIDIGVARPRAQGQAMMSTATALTRAWAMRGSGPHKDQTMKVRTAVPDHRRHKVARDHIGQLLDRRPAALGLGDHLHDLREQGVGPDFLGRESQPNPYG